MDSIIPNKDSGSLERRHRSTTALLRASNQLGYECESANGSRGANSQKELRVCAALSELHNGIGMERNAWGRRMANMRNGSPWVRRRCFVLDVFTSRGTCLLSGLCRCPSPFACWWSIVERRWLASGEADHCIARSVLCIRKNLKGDVLACPLFHHDFKVETYCASLQVDRVALELVS